MYSIPGDFDLNQFNGAVVEQICFAINNISLMLDGSRYISLEGGFLIKSPGDEEVEINVYPVTTDNGLLKFLEQKIEKLSLDGVNNSLFIAFENKMSLTLLASDNYESYTIKTSDQLIRV